ncbi:hypothetical protein SAMN05216226_109102 [Halovenus aranensis]|jgi:hypothetical protein|uniref:Uncharacterized protein n=1 Tax=Halovenus aranensis TaxID=890420 RepID=A0A1G8WLY5_9EURY|nr:hypothetical protein [Halovenus aranensis]SDJ79369.1 hypothetical protein SAMN05216226_109102 [Halovenus aranensis]
MPVETRPDESVEPAPERRPRLTVCESRPGRAVFLEAGNADGWIASDVTVDFSR